MSPSRRGWSFKVVLSVGAGLLVALLSAFQGSGLGAFPSELRFEGALRGASLTESIGIINDSDRPVGVELVASGEAGEWISFKSAGVVIPARSRSFVDVTLGIPNDAANGGYEGAIQVRAPDDEVTLAVEVPVFVEVVGSQRLEAELLAVSVEPAEAGGVVGFVLSLRNSGNVSIRPAFAATIEDPSGTITDRFEFGGDQISPGDAIVAGEWDAANRSPGRYRLTVSGTYQDFDLGSVSTELTLEERGTFTRSVLLRDVRLGNVPAVGGVAAIEVTADNVGEIEALVAVEATLLRGGSRIAEEASPPVRVAAGSSATLEVFFPIEASGSYTVSAYLDYGGATTDARSLGFGVGPGGGGVPLVALLLVLAVVGSSAALVWARKAQLARLRRKLDHGGIGP